MAVRAARMPAADRVLFVGDCGVSRLYKDGIGAAYRTAKAAARTVAFKGVGAAEIEAGYLPLCRAIDGDNRAGRVLFAVTGILQRSRLARAAILRTVLREQESSRGSRRLSAVLWDMFTGSAGYREILWRTFHPGFLGGLGLSAVRVAPACLKPATTRPQPARTR